MELAFVCMGNSPLAAEPPKYFLKMSFVFGNVVRIDENVIKYMMTMTSIKSAKMLFINH